METKNNENENEDNGEEQKQKNNSSTRKRKFNDESLANANADDDGRTQQQQQQQESDTMEQQKPAGEDDDGKNKKKENGGGGGGGGGGNGDDLALESLSREELIKLVIETRTQLETEKAEVLEMRCQMEEKSRHEQQIILQNKQMKIQLPSENWFDLLAFLSRRLLGEIVPIIGNRQFAKIVQPFLHEYGEISLDYKMEHEHPSDSARSLAWHWKMSSTSAQMPTNIKNFYSIKLRYFDRPLVNFLQKFQQNGLLEHVNLSIDGVSDYELVLYHLLPLIGSFNSIELKMVDIYMGQMDEDDKGSEFPQMAMKMMAGTTALKTIYPDDDDGEPWRIDLLCQWLYQLPKADGIPRVLFMDKYSDKRSPIACFIDRIKQDFQVAIHSVSFFIRIYLPNGFQRQEEAIFSIENGKTMERLVTKTYEERNEKLERDEVVLLISRYSMEAAKKWIENIEEDILLWKFGRQNRKIYLDRELEDNDFWKLNFRN